MKRFLFAVILAAGVLSLASSTPSGNAPQEKITVGSYVYSCGFDGFVNMRKTPSFSAEKVGRFNNGECGFVVDEQGANWKKVNVDGNEGWVHVKYLQTEPTIAYTGKVGADWVEGVWVDGYVLMLFNNGTFEWGYEFGTCHGKYIMQRNEIKFIPTWVEEGDYGFDEILPINVKANKLGDYKRLNYLSPEEKAKAEEEEMIFDYGYITKAEFKKYGKALLKIVESEKPIE